MNPIQQIKCGIFLIALLGVFFVSEVHGATYYSRQNGNWSDNNTWSQDSCGGITPAVLIPGSVDDVIICGNHTVIKDFSTALLLDCKTLTVQTGAVLNTGSQSLKVGFAYRVDGIHKGNGQTIFAEASGCSISGIGRVENTGSWIAKNSFFAPVTTLTFTTGTNLTIYSYIDSNSPFTFSLTNNIGSIVTIIDANVTLGANSAGSEGKFYNYGIFSITNGDFNLLNSSSLDNYGTFNVTGNAVGGNVTLIGYLSAIFNYAVATVSGNIWGTSTGSMDMESVWLQSSGSVLNVGGEFFPSGSAGNLIVTGMNFFSIESNTVNYNGAGNQNIKIPDDLYGTYSNLMLSNSGIKKLTGNITVNGNLTIKDVAQLDVSAGNYSIDMKGKPSVGLAGNWTDTSTHTNPFLERNGKVFFSGDTLQTITASPVSGGETFYNLIINNSDTGVVLNNNIKVSDTLTLLDGLIHTRTDTVWVSNSDTASIKHYGDTTYVNGYLKRNISPTSDSSYDFPVGNANAFALANVDFFGSNAVGSLTVDFSNPTGGTALSLLSDANDTGYDRLLNCGGASASSGNTNAGVWNIHPESGSAIYDLTLYGRHYDNPGTMYHSILTRSGSASPWSFSGTYLTASGTEPLLARRTCLTGFNQFAIAGSNTITLLNNTPISFSSIDSMICGSKCIDFSSKNNFSATAWRWTRSGEAFSGIADTALQNPANICFNTSGNYDVRLIASTACYADTLEKIQYINVNPVPTVSIAGAGSICSGKRINLSASSTGTGITYLWSTQATTTAISLVPFATNTYSLVASSAFCSDSTLAIISVTTTPTAAITPDKTTLCSNDSALLTATASAETYLWSTGETTSAIHVQSSDTYTLTLSNGSASGGCSDTSSIAISVTILPTASISGETSICSGKKAVLSATSLVQGVTYAWNTGATNQSINASSQTSSTYSVVLTNGICKDTASLYVSVTATPTLILTANISTICGGDSATLNASAGGGGTGVYLWSSGKSSNTITVIPTISQHYALTLSNGNCFDSDSLFITVVPMPTASINGSSTVCSGNSTGLTALGGITYLWSNAETNTIINITPLINTVYAVTVSNGNGLCTDTASRSITLITPVPADAGTDITIAIGLDTVLTANTGTAWTWEPKEKLDCNTCQSTIAAPFQTTNYILTLTDINGCISSDSVKVYVIPCADLFVPKAFSPNNDGQNDVLYIRGTDCIEKVFSFSVFNRWGEKVFETTDMKSGWEGSQTKQALSNEVFIYYLDALSINGDAIRKMGNVTLMK